MGLDNGRQVHERNWKRLPITSNVIETVHNLGHKQQILNIEWPPHIPLLQPDVNDDVDDDNVRISESVASNVVFVPPLIYAEDHRFILTIQMMKTMIKSY